MHKIGNHPNKDQLFGHEFFLVGHNLATIQTAPYFIGFMVCLVLNEFTLPKILAAYTTLVFAWLIAKILVASGILLMFWPTMGQQILDNFLASQCLVKIGMA